MSLLLMSVVTVNAMDEKRVISMDDVLAGMWELCAPNTGVALPAKTAAHLMQVSMLHAYAQMAAPQPHQHMQNNIANFNNTLGSKEFQEQLVPQSQPVQSQPVLITEKENLGTQTGYYEKKN